MRIDSHQHFWRYSPSEYPWIQSGWGIRGDFLPGDLKPLLAASGFDGCVAVQARQTLEETRWLLGLADKHPAIKGVVGWMDLCSERVDEQLAEFRRHPRLVGVRHVLQDEADDRFMLRPDFLRGIGRLAKFDLAYDVLIFPRHLAFATDLARRFPGQRFVLDHLAKPMIKDAVISPWKEDLETLADEPNVFCKISGMVTEARWRGWKKKDFKPYLDAAWGAFGEDRLMFGSDWPVCLLSGEYPEVVGIVAEWVEQFPVAGRAKFFGDNAARFYRLNPAVPVTAPPTRFRI